MEFFWYDYETTGRDPRVDRPVQFCGVRTNEALRRIGEPVKLYCRPALDHLPHPEACMVHGLSPRKLQEEGVSEAEFAGRIHRELSRPSTCAVGFNALRFDHEVTRFLFYRNLRDPYAWHSWDGNSRWDIIDLLRAAYALRPEGIHWSLDQEGKPSFRLRDLAEANGVLHEPSHDALADVETMLNLARLFRDKQPRLFDYYLTLRDKDKVIRWVGQPSDLGAPFVWVSEKIAAKRGCASLVAPLAFDPAKNDLFAYDLVHDPSYLLQLPVRKLRKEIFKSGSDGGPSPICKIRVNASPFVAPRGVLDERSRQKLGLDEDVLDRHLELLRSHERFGDRVRKAYDRDPEKAEDLDVDQALYAGFIQDGDRRALDRLHRADPTFSGAGSIEFEDDRLAELVFRYRARNFPEELGPEEAKRWWKHCRARHLTVDEGCLTAMDRYEESIAAERTKHPGKEDILGDLEAYGRGLRAYLLDRPV